MKFWKFFHNLVFLYAKKHKIIFSTPDKYVKI